MTPHQTQRWSALLLALTATFAIPPTANAAECAFDQMNGNLIDFGILSAAQSSPVFSATTLQFTCNDRLLAPVSYTVSISAGSSGNFDRRTMRFAAWNIGYNLFVDPVYTRVFGDGMPGNTSETVTGICLSGVTCAVPVYGRLDGGQSLRSGQYSDSVVVTISF